MDREENKGEREEQKDPAKDAKKVRERTETKGGRETKLCQTNNSCNKAFSLSHLTSDILSIMGKWV